VQGVLLWEMHHGCRAWAGMTQSQIIHAVAICKQRLTFARELSDSQAVVAYYHLADTCLVSPITSVLVLGMNRSPVAVGYARRDCLRV